MLISQLAPAAARLRRGGPLQAPGIIAQINRMGRTESAPPHRCTSKLTLSSGCMTGRNHDGLYWRTERVLRGGGELFATRRTP